MGVEPFLMASTLELVIAQRLVRKICDQCRVSFTPKSDELEKMIPGSKKFFGKSIPNLYKGKGCKNCGNTGYKGRTAIYEILVMSEPIRELVLRRSSSDQIKKKALSLGMRTLRQDGWEKIKMGITTPSEVIRVTQQEELED